MFQIRAHVANMFRFKLASELEKKNKNARIKTEKEKLLHDDR